MILLDESLSSTGAFEASYIAAEILTGFAVVGCRGIFSTHLHELASAVPEINERACAEGGVRIDTLVAGIEEGRRSFLIKRARPDGRSYARDIAEKYGLSLDGIRALTHKEPKGDRPSPGGVKNRQQPPTNRPAARQCRAVSFSAFFGFVLTFLPESSLRRFADSPIVCYNRG